MLHGDISNVQSTVIGIRLENTILKKEIKLPQRVLNSLNIKSFYDYVDTTVLNLMYYIYQKTDYTLYLVVGEEFPLKMLEGNSKFKDFLFNLPVSQMWNVLKSESEITMDLITGRMTYYVDNNETRRGLINHKAAISFDEFNKLVPRKR